MTDAQPHRAIYRRWRAQRFGEIIGQEPIVTSLRNAVRLGRVHHAFLFVGPRGTGKTSTARILAKAINCSAPVDGEPDDACPSCIAIREGRALDVIELDAASNNKVDDMRGLLERTWTAPADLTTKVFIIDEVQRIREGWDVLLKTLEEPPPRVVFVFCTTDPSQIRPAVVSRVQRYDFRRLAATEIEGKLRTILTAEGRTADDDAIALISRLAAGGMRDAESMLDQLLGAGDGPIDADAVRELLGLADDESVDGFVDSLVRGDALAGLSLLDDLESRGRDLRTFLDQVVEALRIEIGNELAGRSTGRDPLAVRAAARRLAILDPSRAGPGGLRFQLEIAILESAAPLVPGLPDRPAATRPVVRKVHPEPAAEASPEPVPVGPGPTGQDGPPRPTRVEGESPPTISAQVPAGPAEEPPTASAQEAEASAPATSEGDGSDLAVLIGHWPEIVAHISKHPPTRPLISVCRPIAVDGAVVTLGFPEGMAFLADVAERRRANLEEGIAVYLGHQVVVRCVATNLDVTAAAGQPDADALLTEARRIFADDLAEVGEVE